MIIPFYYALPSENFEKLDASSVEDRADFMWDDGERETPEIPSTDVDKFFDEIQEAIARETGDADLANSAVFGKEDWDGENVTDGMRINRPDEVSRVAQALNTINQDVVENVANMRFLVKFYDEAAKRGDAMVIMFN